MPEAPSVEVEYVDLLARAVLGLASCPSDIYLPVDPDNGRWSRRLVQRALLRRGHSVLAYRRHVDTEADPEGRRFVTQLPPGVLTMVGQKRLANAVDCVADVLARGVAGDVIETGVWRGGTSIVMRGALNALGGRDRKLFVADSFAGLPPPDPDRYPADAGQDLHTYSELAVGIEQVRDNFRRCGLGQDNVEFVQGFFRDTLPALQGHSWAVCRLDGDLYESTMDGLTNLYPGLSEGGWIIVDDYHAIPACAQAVTDYRREHSITEPITTIDWGGVCWRKGDPAGGPPPPLGILRPAG